MAKYILPIRVQYGGGLSMSYEIGLDAQDPFDAYRLVEGIAQDILDGEDPIVDDRGQQVDVQRVSLTSIVSDGDILPIDPTRAFWVKSPRTEIDRITRETQKRVREILTGPVNKLE